MADGTLSHLSMRKCPTGGLRCLPAAPAGAHLGLSGLLATRRRDLSEGPSHLERFNGRLIQHPADVGGGVLQKKIFAEPRFCERLYKEAKPKCGEGRTVRDKREEARGFILALQIVPACSVIAPHKMACLCVICGDGHVTSPHFQHLFLIVLLSAPLVVKFRRKASFHVISCSVSQLLKHLTSKQAALYDPSRITLHNPTTKTTILFQRQTNKQVIQPQTQTQ